jgi:hypothetical protein
VHFAAGNNNVEVLRVLLEAGAANDSLDDVRSRPLLNHQHSLYIWIWLTLLVCFSFMGLGGCARARSARLKALGQREPARPAVLSRPIPARFESVPSSQTLAVFR